MISRIILIMIFTLQGTTMKAEEVLKPYTHRTNIAHRGASFLAPEHTLAAYKLALEHHADYVEPDIQISKDGHLVCMHDGTLDRTTNVEDIFPDRCRDSKGKKSWYVVDFTLAELKKLDAGAWKGEKFAGEKIPTFKEMVKLIKGKAGIIPETKVSKEYADLGLNMQELLMKELKDLGLSVPGADPKTPVIIQSFSKESLIELKDKLSCKLPLVYLLSDNKTNLQISLKDLEEFKAFADGIAPQKGLVEKHLKLVKQAHQLNMSVTVWTFRQDARLKEVTVKKEMQDFFDRYQVDAVFTDNPEEFPFTAK